MPTDILHRTSPRAAISLRGLSFAVAALALGANPAAAQKGKAVQLANTGQPAAVSPVVDDGSTTLVMYTVRTDLRRLVMAQEAYWTTRKAYAPDVAALTSFHADPGVTVQIVHARADGWAARATYGNGATGVGVRSCVVWVGNVDPAERPATDVEHKVYPEAETSCDGDGYNAKAEWAAAGQSYMTYALNKLVVNEARYFAFHHRYTAVVAQLDPFIWDKDVSVEIVAATPTGWAARATFGAAPGKKCVMKHGSLAATDLSASAAPDFAGIPGDYVTCDGDATRATASATSASASPPTGATPASPTPASPTPAASPTAASAAPSNTPAVGPRTNH